MTKLFTTTFLFLLIACRESNTVSTILDPDTKDINDIIEIIVIQDSLPFSNTEIMSPSPLLIELRKIQVIVPSIKEEAPSPDDDTTISIFYLLNSLINNQKFFDQTDSSFLLSQNNSIKSFSLNKTVTQKLVAFATGAELRREIELNMPSHYYTLSIPILSTNKQKAYVEWRTICAGCDGATAFFLEKINNKWTILGSQEVK